MNLMDLFIKVGVKDEASAPIKKLSGAVGKGLATAAKVGVAAVGALYAGTVALGTAFVKGAAELASYGDNIDKMSQKMGMSAQAYQEWDAILQHSGTSIDSMQRGMMTLSKAAEDGSDAFQKIGLSQEEVASMSQEELFAATIKGLQGMEEGSERAVLAQKLLGTAAKELGPLLNTSAEETEEMRQKLHKLGGVMSDEDVKAAAKFTDSLQDMKTVFSGLKVRMLKDFMPALTTVMDGVQELLTGDSALGMDMIKNGIENITDRISEVLPEIISLATKLLGTVGKSLIKQIPQTIGKILPGLLEGAGELVKALFDAIPGLLETGGSILEMLFQYVASGDFDKAVDNAVDGINNIINKIIDWLSDEKNLSNLIESAIHIVTALAKGIIKFAVNLVAKLPELILEIVNWFTDAENLQSLADAGVEIVNALWDGLKAAWPAVKGWAKEAIKTLFTGTSTASAYGSIVDAHFGGGKKFAIGNDYVPYDNYPALLHRGEAVLTAREAEAWRRGTTGGQIVNNFTFNGVSQSDLDYIVGYVNRELVSG